MITMMKWCYKMKKIILILFLFVLFLSSCKKDKDDVIQNKECIHEHKTWVVVNDATCIKQGSKKQVCDSCKETLTTAIIPILNHEEVTLEEVKPTCTKTGLTMGSCCKNCGYVILEQVIIPELGHNYHLDNDLSNDEVLVYKCICGDSYEIKNDSNDECVNHVEGDWKIIEESTCSKLGVKEIRCINCDIVLKTESIAYKDHTESILEKIDPTCNNTGLTEGVICKVCSKVIKEQQIIEKLEHDYKITETLNPSAYEKGYIKYTCSLCNHSYTEELDALGSYNPNNPVTILLNNGDVIVTNNNGGVLIEEDKIIISLAGEYDILGTINEGAIIVRLNDEERATINLQGVNITSTKYDPIFIESGDEVDVSAKSGTINFIYDKRIVGDVDATGGAIYAKVDLDIKGKGELNIESTYNNGIATTKDLNIKNLTLNVNVPNNALKGNDSVTIESGKLTLISSSGDAIKTENSDISDSGKQRGIIHIIDGELNLYAGCDGIDASYDAIIDGGIINIFTERYSEYTGDIETTVSDTMYLRISSRAGISSSYKYSALYILEDGSNKFVNGTLDSNPSSRYYKFDEPTGAHYVKFFVYNASQTQGQSENYVYSSDQLTIPDTYDTYYVTTIYSGKLSGSWTNYQTGGGPGGGRPGGMGPGGMQEGNSESAMFSCKGIKADNSVTINNGTITIKSHDDALHANSDVTLENGLNGNGNLTINGGKIILTTEDDGIHADGTLIINGGDIILNKTYEGVEGNLIYFKGGSTSIKSNDDGINAKTTLYFQGGVVYLDAGGDGIDSNGAVYMSGGIVLAIGPSNGGNGVIDIGDRGYSFSFTGGLLLAIGCSGMDVAPVGTSGNTVSASRVTSNYNSYLTITSNGEIVAVLKVTKSSQTYRVFAYNNETYPNATITSSTSTNKELVNDLYYVKNE